MGIIKEYKLMSSDSLELTDLIESTSPVSRASGPASSVVRKTTMAEESVMVPTVKVRPAPIPVVSVIPAPKPISTQAPSKIQQPVIKPSIDEGQKRKDLENELAEHRRLAEADVVTYRDNQFRTIEAEKEEIKQEAYDEGFQEGLKNGEASLADQSAEILVAINDAVKEKNKLLKKARGEVLRLAMKVAEQILKSEISLNQAVCVNIVAEAISKITDKDKVIVRVNRLDADFVKLNKDRFLKQMEDIRNLIIQEDSRVEQGGCIIETDLGYIDSTISTKLASIERALFRVYEEEETEEDAEL